MSDHEAFRGVYVDHLYRDCPSLRQRTPTATPCCPEHRSSLGTRLVGLVDPEGSDICGMCAHRWRRKGGSA